MRILPMMTVWHKYSLSVAGSMYDPEKNIDCSQMRLKDNGLVRSLLALIFETVYSLGCFSTAVRCV